MPTLACPFCSKPMRTDNGLKWHMENIHGQAHDSSESNVPTVGSDAPDERHACQWQKKGYGPNLTTLEHRERQWSKNILTIRRLS